MASVPRDSIWSIESPRYDAPWEEAGVLSLRGWVAGPDQLRRVRVVGAGVDVLAELGDRPDVTGAYGLPSTGFTCLVRPIAPAEHRLLDVRLEFDDRVIPLALPTQDRYQPVDVRRARKASALVPRLRCPRCAGRVDKGLRSLRCRDCRLVLGRRRQPLPIDALPDELRTEFAVVPTENVSANEYDPFALDLIRRFEDGLILDCGAGFRSVYHHNVVNLEIANYPSTDVLAVGERLPFADDSFDCVFSFAVLEHVKDPFACAREIERVLKPGGLLYAQIPFLQPRHGYPHHYYNMTLQGALNLFPGLSIDDAGVFPFGQPVFTLSWFLNSWAAGLPEAARESFLDMSVRELMAPAHQFLGAPFVTALQPEVKSDLASCHYILARK